MEKKFDIKVLNVSMADRRFVQAELIIQGEIILMDILGIKRLGHLMRIEEIERNARMKYTKGVN